MSSETDLRITKKGLKQCSWTQKYMFFGHTKKIHACHSAWPKNIRFLPTSLRLLTVSKENFQKNLCNSKMTVNSQWFWDVTKCHSSSSKPNSKIFWFQRVDEKSIIIPFKIFVVVSNMSICTIHILIARTICYTRLLSPLLLLRLLLQFTHCSLASQKYQICVCLYFSLQIILLNFQETRRDKSLMWPKGCSSVKVWWSGTL